MAHDSHRLVRDESSNNLHLAKLVDGELRALCNARYRVWDYGTIGQDRDVLENAWSWNACARCEAAAAKGKGLRAAVVCHHCDQLHEATYHHEGQFGEGPIYVVVCTADDLHDFYTTEVLTFSELGAIR